MRVERDDEKSVDGERERIGWEKEEQRWMTIQQLNKKRGKAIITYSMQQYMLFFPEKGKEQMENRQTATRYYLHAYYAVRQWRIFQSKSFLNHPQTNL